MNKCSKWIKNPLINPYTSRRIKYYGPTYNKFYGLCDRQINCDNWRNNSLVNPVTGRNIRENSLVYRIIRDTCTSSSDMSNLYDKYNLNRFIQIQNKKAPSGISNYDIAVKELRTGKKYNHWIWYIFPQYKGLGRSEMSRFYAINSLTEARNYINHPILGMRYLECVSILLNFFGLTALDIFSTDTIKVHSSLTLFYYAAPENLLIRRALLKYYNGTTDSRTDEICKNE